MNLSQKRVAQSESSTGERGAFTAVVSTWEVDRQHEAFAPGAFSASLGKWRRSGRRIPVLLDHAGTTASVVGYADPRMCFETSEGLTVSGMINVATDIGHRAHELLKEGAVAWSIGSIVPKGAKRRRGDHVEITEAVLCEISVVPVPANPGVRTLSVKSAATPGKAAPSLAEIDAEVKALGIDPRPIQVASFDC
jgi:HK97 family phage prohead protease